MVYTLYDARSVTIPTGIKIKPINRNVEMTCKENDLELEMHIFQKGIIKYSRIVKELTAAGVRTGLHAGRFCCVN